MLGRSSWPDYSVSCRFCFAFCVLREGEGRRARLPNSTRTNCRPSLAAGTLEYRHVNLNSFLLRSLCRQTSYLGLQSASSGDILRQRGIDYSKSILPFSIGGPFSAGIVLRDSSPRPYPLSFTWVVNTVLARARVTKTEDAKVSDLRERSVFW